MEQEITPNLLRSLEANLTAAFITSSIAQSEQINDQDTLNQLYGTFSGIATSYLQAVQDPQHYEIASEKFRNRLDSTKTDLETIMLDSLQSPEKAQFVNKMIEDSISDAFSHLENPAETYLNLDKRIEIYASIESGLSDPEVSKEEKSILSMYKAVADISMQNALGICNEVFGYIPQEAKMYLPSPPEASNDNYNPNRDAA